jgi:lipoyl synthase
MHEEGAGIASAARGNRFPPWLRKRLPADGRGGRVSNIIRDLHLATVCSSAHCPNMGECFACGTATFMILGDICTRACGFCAVQHGAPRTVEADEPERVARAASHMALTYVVVTSVTRDDLRDGGAGQFAATVAALRNAGVQEVEVLTPDFNGDHQSIDRVAASRPTVYNHNLETVSRLYREVRPQAVYTRSLGLLARVREKVPGLLVKSGLMLGLGESHGEVIEAMADLHAAGCDLLTLGQYLRPSPAHLPVARFVPPDELEQFRREGEALGFKGVAAGPFVRSSYKAQDFLASAEKRRAAKYAH